MSREMLFPWYLCGLLFVLPFVDPRRPFRLLHLDLLALVVAGVGPLTYYVTVHQPAGSLVLTLLCLGYLLPRLLRGGFRRAGGSGRLVPLVPATWLLVALVLLVCFRLGYALTDQVLVRDVGVASVLGADRIADGRDLYDDRIDPQSSFPHPDSYGPAAYLLYVPFEQLFPVGDELIGDPGYEDPVAGRVAAIAFDLLVLLGLFALGRQWRPGAEGRLLGLGLAWAWASYPYSLFQLRYGFNDTLVALLVLAALLALRSAAGRGALTALAAATKFAPAALVPVMATGTGERRTRSTLVFAAAFAAVSLALFLPLLPDGGVSEFWERTLGYQQGRTGWNTLWGRFPELDWVQLLAQAGVVGLAVLVAFVPRTRRPEQVALLGAAVMVAMQLSMTYWFSAYLLWFAPLAFAGLFALYDCRDRAWGGAEARAPRARRRVEPIRA